MNFANFKDQILIGLMGIGVTILFWIASSISTLNINVAVVLEKVANHELRINKLEGNK